jgi:hypothetical protein
MLRLEYRLSLRIRLRLTGMLTRTDLLRLADVLSLTGVPGLNMALLVAIGLFDLFANGTLDGARRLCRGTAPRRLSRRLLVLRGRPRPLSPYRGLDTLPHFLRQDRCC